jgi:nucleoside-triphosphatase
VVQFRGEDFPLIYNEKFDIYGVELIQRAREKSQLIVMDECGNLEQFSISFQSKILDTLDEKTPILGVVKQASWGWTDRIRNHPQVKLITVTRENRNQLPELIADYIG